MPQSSRPPQQVRLLVTREEAAERLGERVQAGRALAERQIDTEEECDQAEADFSRWENYTRDLLHTLFVPSSLVEVDLDAASIPLAIAPMRLDGRVDWFRRDARRHVNALASIVERLEFMLPPSQQPGGEHPDGVHPGHGDVGAETKRDIFIVHGHDVAARESVARLLVQLGLRPIILMEQPSAGKTIIEMLEARQNVPFAVVLLTPDDMGGPAGQPDKFRPRARQNVLVELGLFAGRLGRERVCVLRRAEVEIPSDYAGVVYRPFDDAGAWKMELAKELKAAGYAIDLNALVP